MRLKKEKKVTSHCHNRGQVKILVNNTTQTINNLLINNTTSLYNNLDQIPSDEQDITTPKSHP